MNIFEVCRTVYQLYKLTVYNCHLSQLKSKKSLNELFHKEPLSQLGQNVIVGELDAACR